MPRLLPKISNRFGCLLLTVILALVIVILVLIGINAMPGNELAETVQTIPG